MITLRVSYAIPVPVMTTAELATAGEKLMEALLAVEKDGGCCDPAVSTGSDRHEIVAEFEIQGTTVTGCGVAGIAAMWAGLKRAGLSQYAVWPG